MIFFRFINFNFLCELTQIHSSNTGSVHQFNILYQLIAFADIVYSRPTRRSKHLATAVACSNLVQFPLSWCAVGKAAARTCALSKPSWSIVSYRLLSYRIGFVCTPPASLVVCVWRQSLDLRFYSCRLPQGAELFPLSTLNSTPPHSPHAVAVLSFFWRVE